MSTSQVPVRPIAKGSMTRLWAGLAFVALVSGAVAWKGSAVSAPNGCAESDLPRVGKIEALASGVLVETGKAGTGGSPALTDVALLNYRGLLKNGTEFDAGQQAVFPVGGVIKGFSEALQKMQRGGFYHICIPSDLAYGEQSPGEKIPANSALIFEVELLDFQSEAAVRAMQQQMQQQQQGAGGQPQPQQQGQPQGQ